MHAVVLAGAKSHYFIDAYFVAHLIEGFDCHDGGFTHPCRPCCVTVTLLMVSHVA